MASELLICSPGRHLQKAAEERKQEREKLAGTAAWRPGAGGPKQGATPSILKVNLRGM